MDVKVLILAASILLSGLFYLMLSPLTADQQSGPTAKNMSPLFECSSEADCGRPAFTGLYACRGGNVYGEYSSYVCVADDSGSKCVQLLTMEYVRNCIEPQECVPGLNECRTERSTTIAYTPAVTYTQPARLPSSTTTLSDVTCVRDTNCGIDHYSKPYCTTSGHSVRDYITYTCLNPGTYSSQCTRQKKTYLVDYCGFDQACIMGECVEKRYLSWYCVREDCCATDFSSCGNYSVQFLPFPIANLKNETYTLEHNTTIYP